MASRGLHPGIGVGGSAVGVERAGRNGTVPSRPDVDVSAVDELQRAVTWLERANDALQRENARLARSAGGQTGPAAAVRLTRAERRWSEDVEAVERRWSERLEAAELEVERLTRLLATPRHLAVERAREALMRSRFHSPVRGIWAWVAKGLRLHR